MPTVPVSPSTRIHSWSLLYLVVLMTPSLPVAGSWEGGSDSAAMIVLRHEGEIDDARRQRLAAHRQGQRRAGRRGVCRDIAHGDGAVDGRAEAAAGDFPDRAAVRQGDRGMLARRRPRVGPDADTPPRRAVPELSEDHVRAGE